MSPAEHRVICGGPGAGKTMIVLHRARYLLDNYQAADDRYAIFVFSKTLADYIRSSLKLLKLDAGAVTTFDSWCVTFYQSRIGGQLPWREKEACPDFDEVRKQVL